MSNNENETEQTEETNEKQKLSRRGFLRAAGGVTFLALTPVGQGLFSLPAEAKSASTPNSSGATTASGTSRLPPKLPLFTALPYIQPGAASKLVESQETIVIAWQTQSIPAEFKISFGEGKKLTQNAQIARSERMSGDPKDDGEKRFNYAATLAGLKLNREYAYRVTGNGQTILEGYFTTRKPRGSSTRFVAFGDNSYGDISDRAIAFQAYQARPDFVMNTGDNVYDDGLDNEYARYFFPVYNADQAGQRTGAPLLRSVPFYTVIANHDVHQKDDKKNPVADFDKFPDSLAYFTNMHLPLNGPLTTIPTIGKPDVQDAFKQASGARFPRMANYSFDYGDCHFLCLDSNIYVDPTDASLQSWIENDLKNTDAIWKFVAYHHPAFNVGDDHYAEQHMRALMPLWEKYGVDIVLNGHEHNYQRPQPIRFAPTDLTAAKTINTKKRLTPGVFTVDRVFDGVKNTRANGVLHIVTGAGGKHLYDPDQNENPASWLHSEDKNVAYNTRMVTDRHSLSVFEVNGRALKLTQIDENGNAIDTIRLTK